MVYPARRSAVASGPMKIKDGWACLDSIRRNFECDRWECGRLSVRDKVLLVIVIRENEPGSKGDVIRCRKVYI